MSGQVGAGLIDDVDPALNVNQELPADVAAFDSKANGSGGSVKMIPIALIKENEVALRGVQRDTEKYQQLVASIQRRGVLNSILVREQKSSAGVTTYGLVDGLQRFNAAQDAGLDVIPARIVSMDDAELLEAQIITNMTRIETKPVQLTEHLVRILARNPFMTRAELAERICQSTTWLDERLSLNKLDKDIARLVDSGSIKLTNAYALAKIPTEEQKTHVDAAMTEDHTTFVPRMKARVKEIREAKKAGKDASPQTYQPVHFMQKMADVKTELEKKQVRDTLFAQNGVKGDAAEKAWDLALLWTLHYDENSKAAQIAKNEERVKKRKEEAEKRKVENADKKEKKAAQEAVRIDTGW